MALTSGRDRQTDRQRAPPPRCPSSPGSPAPSCAGAAPAAGRQIHARGHTLTGLCRTGPCRTPRASGRAGPSRARPPPSRARPPLQLSVNFFAIYTPPPPTYIYVCVWGGGGRGGTMARAHRNAAARTRAQREEGVRTFMSKFKFDSDLLGSKFDSDLAAGTERGRGGIGPL